VSEAASNVTVGQAVKDYFREFAKLRHASRKFWVVQLVNLLDGVAYFAMLPALTLYLSENLGYGDTAAGWWFGILMGVYTLVGFVAGFVGDALGIKRTLLISVVILVIARVVISIFTIKAVVIPALFLIMVGTAIMTPVLVAATKRYTTKQTRTAGFNFMYFLWNIGVILAGPALDFARSSSLGNRGIFMLGSVMSILCWLVIMFLMRDRIRKTADDHEAEKSGEDEEDEEADGDDKAWENPLAVAWSVIRETAFWRFMLFLVLVVGVKLVFEYWHALSPKYYLRVIGPDAPVGTINSLNGWVICIGLVISTPIVARFKLFNVMLLGICISAVSVLIPAISPGIFGAVDPASLARIYYMLILGQVLLFSLGEVIWSPRIYEYTAAIAPKGREASYMGLSNMPMFFARMLVGPLSGFMLVNYCPEGTTAVSAASVPYMQSPQFMWLLLGGLALASPVLILLLRKVIQKEAAPDV
jgi:proton-dependent oligopeptide transporter, POT family